MKTLPSVALGTWSWGTGFAGEAGRVLLLRQLMIRQK